MDKKLNRACHKAINALAVSKKLHVKEIKEVIIPYVAAETVARILLEHQFVKSLPYDKYEITPYGMENLDYFDEEERLHEREEFRQKMTIVQAWVNTVLAVAAFVLSIVAMFVK